jgi:hypothetical protein
MSNVTSDRSCPPGFAYSNHKHAGRDEPCEYAHHTHACHTPHVTHISHVGPGTCRCTSSTSLGLRWSTTRLLPVIRVRTCVVSDQSAACVGSRCFALPLRVQGSPSDPKTWSCCRSALCRRHPTWPGRTTPCLSWNSSSSHLVRRRALAAAVAASCLLAIGLLTPHQTESVSGECRTIDDCEEFINDVARNRDALPYVPGSVQCVRPTTAGLPNSTLSGCAVVRTQHPS